MNVNLTEIQPIEMTDCRSRCGNVNYNLEPCLKQTNDNTANHLIVYQDTVWTYNVTYMHRGSTSGRGARGRCPCAFSPAPHPSCPSHVPR